ncbi:hypothetical protein OO013_13510 [Mangrovivirga sp. M17]|uniref:Uncharacterized protein n=1 Tax=Mangrovivirga halotolerans TaxID=2993936 RepID=A0ABT3RU68_9BACT|nr:hypothetical protein [Mangrovivirga halotolerans]MCX2744894.1 hypothetical protein [Mangrovivirga halotolerans]
MGLVEDFIQYIFPFISLILGLIKFKKLDRGMKILLVYLFYCVVSEIILRYYATVYRNNLFYYNIYPLLDFIIISAYISNIIELTSLKKWVRRVFIPFFVVAFSIYLFTQYDQLDKVTLPEFRSIGSFIIVISVLLYYYSLLVKRPYPNLFFNQHFIVSVGLIIYYAGTFMTWLFLETLFNTNLDLFSLFTSTIHIFLFLFIKYLTILIAILKAGYSKRLGNVGA